MLYFIYNLTDPRNNSPFYVGITKNPNPRMLHHLTAIDNNDKKRARINEIQADGLSPLMRILEITDNREEADQQEKSWIKQYLTQNIQLTNIRLIRPLKKKIAKPEKREYNKPLHQIETAKEPPTRIPFLTFNKLDEMWKTLLGPDDLSIPAQMEHLEQFISTFSYSRPLNAKETRNFNIWCEAKHQQVLHPEHYPFCNVV
jgi:predicted GIY-YIG superfamily endonuclease